MNSVYASVPLQCTCKLIDLKMVPREQHGPFLQMFCSPPISALVLWEPWTKPSAAELLKHHAITIGQAGLMPFNANLVGLYAFGDGLSREHNCISFSSLSTTSQPHQAVKTTSRALQQLQHSLWLLQQVTQPAHDSRLSLDTA